MRNDDDRTSSAIELPKQIDNSLGIMLIQVPGGFIAQDYFSTLRQRSRNRYALSFSPRQVARKCVPESRHTYHFQSPHTPLRALLPWKSTIHESQFSIFESGPIF
jgi:hypothetical protein